MDSVPSHKSCTGCGETKPLDGFYKKKGHKYGVDSWCKPCRAEQLRRYREANREELAEYQRRYRDENPEKVAQSRARGYVRNREVVIDKAIRYYMENRESLSPLANRRHAERQQLTSAISIVPPGTRFGVNEDALLLEDNGMTVYQKAIALGRSYSSCRGRLDYIRSRVSV